MLSTIIIIIVISCKYVHLTDTKKPPSKASSTKSKRTAEGAKKKTEGKRKRKDSTDDEGLPLPTIQASSKFLSVKVQF